MNELSVFIDESGSDGLKDRYYLLTLVLHEQGLNITRNIEQYEQSLASRRLPDLAFHASPLMNGHGDYEGMALSERKKLLSSFRVFFRHMPISYACISLKCKEYASVEEISNAMRRQLVDLLFDKLDYFQSFDSVKIYYDNGQQSIADAVHKAMDYALSNGVVVYKDSAASGYRLAQAADYICTMELTALKYADKVPTATDEKFFGSWSQFKRGILKEIRSKQI